MTITHVTTATTSTTKGTSTPTKIATALLEELDGIVASAEVAACCRIQVWIQLQ